MRLKTQLNRLETKNVHERKGDGNENPGNINRGEKITGIKLTL